MWTGFYTLEFDGALGKGKDLLLLNGGVVLSLAEEQLHRSGIYVHDEKTGMIDLDILLVVPPGALLKGGVRVPLQATIPEGGCLSPLEAETPIGPFRVTISKVEELHKTGTHS